ncbi:MAG: hypothetical protein QXT45_04645 [Candidatus Bilamarchaeaceae archaeon]
MVTREDLVEVATELNSVLGLHPPIQPEGKDDIELARLVLRAWRLVAPLDPVSDRAREITSLLQAGALPVDSDNFSLKHSKGRPPKGTPSASVILGMVLGDFFRSGEVFTDDDLYREAVRRGVEIWQDLAVPVDTFRSIWLGYRAILRHMGILECLDETEKPRKWRFVR